MWEVRSSFGQQTGSGSSCEQSPPQPGGGGACLPGVWQSLCHTPEAREPPPFPYGGATVQLYRLRQEVCPEGQTFGALPVIPKYLHFFTSDGTYAPRLCTLRKSRDNLRILRVYTERIRGWSADFPSVHLWCTPENWFSSHFILSNLLH